MFTFSYFGHIDCDKSVCLSLSVLVADSLCLFLNNLENKFVNIDKTIIFSRPVWGMFFCLHLASPGRLIQYDNCTTFAFCGDEPVFIFVSIGNHVDIFKF